MSVIWTKCILTWQQSSTFSYIKCNFRGLSPRWSSSLRGQGKAASAESGVRSDSFSEQENIRGSWGGSGSCGTLLAHSSCGCHFAAATDKGFGPHLCPSLQNRDTSPELWQVLSLKEKLWCGFRHHWSKPQDQQRKDAALIRCSFYICQNWMSRGRNVPAPLWSCRWQAQFQLWPGHQPLSPVFLQQSLQIQGEAWKQQGGSCWVSAGRGTSSQRSSSINKL